MLAANQPAHPAEVSALVRRMLNHYRQADLNEADLKGVLEDWIDDLGDFPLDVLRDAFAAYRTGPRASFRPLPGNIIDLAKDAAGYRLRLAERAVETLEAIRATQTQGEAA